ncbi:MAG: thioredoxin domain-containing protein [Bacteroidetes bacterium]|nr:thioredoxin domain-containing protein [Bacteroidota bacterium]
MRDSRLPNLLVHERSPYLLQHAYNPVMWRPWSDAAFALARVENKPVFVSIGYATCHWCHVMERESFENDDVAAYLNEHYICVKVDREERPDIDAIYMDVCQAMTGHGGWPLTVMMDADQRPFFAGTYFPRESRGGRLGFLDLLSRLHDVWQNDRARVDESAREITAMVRDRAAADLRGTVDASIEQAVVDHHVRMFDDVYGGFGAQPKFPSPHHLLYLMRCAAHRTGDARTTIVSMVTSTLDAMRAGGLFDHVGFGFHRYSTDRAWLVPHFEKMLYDQAMLMMAYTEAWQITGDDAYRVVVDEIVTYVQRELVSTDAATRGAFTSAQDADSDGEEGTYYVWSMEELRSHGASDEMLAKLGVRADGNFHDEASGAATGMNILHCAPDHLRSLMHDEEWQTLRTTLLRTRTQRIAPITDTKVLVDWNGLMIAALAKAGRSFDRPSYTALAMRAYDVVHTAASHVCGGHSTIPLMLDDRAALAWAAFELHQTTGDETYRQHVEERLDEIDRHHHDPVHGGYCTLAHEHATSLIARQKQTYDGAYPSGTSITAYVQARMGRTTDTIDSVAALLRDHAPGHCMLLCAWDVTRRPYRTITIGGQDASILRAVHAAFLPNVTLRYEASERPFVMLCEGESCRLPVHDLDAVQQLLAEVR